MKRGQPGFRRWFRAPILDGRCIAGIEVVAKVMRGRKPCNVGECRARRRNGSMSKIRVEAARRESTSVRRKPRKHRSHRRRERESIFSMHIHDRFEPEAVTDHKNHAATKVTDRNGEHAAKPGQEVNSPMFISVENEFGIGTST